jgi:hypothetical protein
VAPAKVETPDEPILPIGSGANIDEADLPVGSVMVVVVGSSTQDARPRPPWSRR